MTSPEPNIIESVDDEASAGFDGATEFLQPMTAEQFASEFQGFKMPGIVPSPSAKAPNELRQRAIDYAMSFVGQPYSWGNLDCSGLVQKAYAHIGVDLPRISFQQANYGRTIAQNEAQAGDLVAWDNSDRNDGADHIAIYLGGGKILEAPRTGLNVRVRDLGPGEGNWFVSMSAGVD